MNTPRPGDLLLVSGESLADRVIQAAQHIRYRGAAGEPWRVSHVAVLVDEDGNLIQATSRHGIIRGHVADYAGLSTRLAATGLDGVRAADAVRFADACMGWRYDWLAIITTGLALATGGTLNLTGSRAMICSEFAARCLEHGGVILPRDPAQTAPADLAALYPVPHEGGEEGEEMEGEHSA